MCLKEICPGISEPQISLGTFLNEWKVVQDCLFFSVRSVTLLSFAPLPLLRVALRETRLIDPGDGSEKIPHQCETLPWFRLSRDPWLRVG